MDMNTIERTDIRPVLLTRADAMVLLDLLREERSTCMWDGTLEIDEEINLRLPREALLEAFSGVLDYHNQK